MKLKKIIIFIVLLFTSFSLFAKNPFQYPVSTVFIDAGHGGKDPGANRSWYFSEDPILEKDITLKVALKVGEYLKQMAPSLNIIQTRVDDVYLTLQERSEVSFLYPLDKKSSALFVSIHVNAVASSQASGFEVYTKLKDKNILLFDNRTPIENIPFFAIDSVENLNKYMYEKSSELASSINLSIAKQFPLNKNRGVKQEDLYVLNVCRTSGVLIEIGFVSNEEEAREMIDDSYLSKMAKAIADGIYENLN